MYPILSQELASDYEQRTPFSVENFLRGFVFGTRAPGDMIDEEDYSRFPFDNAHTLRLRVSYLYWVQLHTGEVEPQLHDSVHNFVYQRGPFDFKDASK
jgi:hypothetical protein